ncbi:MAG: hypothetical protein LC648_07145 [Novosphingobium sp.]|nr:hypothetical protein [Novosphingobium sp.]
MKALPLIALFALAGVAGAAAESSPPAPLVLDELRFEVRGSGSVSVEIRSADGRSSVTVARSRLSEVAGFEANGPVRFAVAAEAGRTECSGTRKGDSATGVCRFASSPAYETGLAQRGVRLERRRDLLALALVDARLALVDQLSRDGLAPADSGNLIAAAALGITGPWAHELREAGLDIAKFDDLIAARALKLDGAFVRAMADAGYARLTARQAITMKAVGVTPAYAEAMNRVADAAHAVEGMGELQ